MARRMGPGGLCEIAHQAGTTLREGMLSPRERSALSPQAGRGQQRKLRLQDQLLYPPVQQFADIEHVLGRTGHRMDPAELFQLLAGLAEHAEHLAIEAEL